MKMLEPNRYRPKFNTHCNGSRNCSSIHQWSLAIKIQGNKPTQRTISDNEIFHINKTEKDKEYISMP